VDELRWFLLLTGIALVGAIYIYTRFKSRIDRGLQATISRSEPSLNSVSVEAAALPANDHDTPVLVEPEVTAEPEPESEPDPNSAVAGGIEPMIVAVRLMARNREGFKGEKLILTMRELGLQHGSYGIFHRQPDDADSRADFSVASLLEPGAFDLTKVKTDLYPGVSIFMSLPGSKDGIEIFDDMLATSRSLAERLEGELFDEQGSSLSVQRERYLREEVIAFEHRGLN
jgi:cell division protein ZipA